jgi:CubicO group peptidase (beta-lactamase class C family)
MSDIDGLEMKSRVDEILSRHPALGFALGVVRNGSLEFFHTHGLADLASNRPVAEDTVFRVASITKTFTAIAVMQLWEQGLVELDAPANDYLRAYQLIPANTSWRPATVRHLLTHTAGIAEQVPRSGIFRTDFGESVKLGRPVPSLADYYRGGLRLTAEPGTMFRYADHGPATLGQIVEDVSGMSLNRYLREHVFEPLGMADTTLVRSEVVQSWLATGYKLSSTGPKPVTDREVVTAGAGGTYSTPKDMARYLAALLGGGANEHGTVLKPATLASMFAAQYQPHPRIPGMGMAFWRRTAGGHPVVEHQGIIPGFDSQILAAPDDGVGLMAFTNGASRAVQWMPVEMSRLLHHLVGVPEDVIQTDVPQRPEIWGDLCGWYYLPGPLTDVRLRTIAGVGVEVFVRRGQLVLRFLTPIPALYRGFPLHPADDTDPYAFRMDLSEFGLGPFTVVFSSKPETETMAVHFDVMPVSAYGKSAATNPRLWADAAIALSSMAILGRRFRRVRRKRKA